MSTVEKEPTWAQALWYDHMEGYWTDSSGMVYEPRRSGKDDPGDGRADYVEGWEWGQGSKHRVRVEIRTWHGAVDPEIIDQGTWVVRIKVGQQQNMLYANLDASGVRGGPTDEQLTALIEAAIAHAYARAAVPGRLTIQGTRFFDEDE
jgi:hypothetical protein